MLALAGGQACCCLKLNWLSNCKINNMLESILVYIQQKHRFLQETNMCSISLNRDIRPSVHELFVINLKEK